MGFEFSSRRIGCEKEELRLGRAAERPGDETATTQRSLTLGQFLDLQSEDDG